MGRRGSETGITGRLLLAMAVVTFSLVALGGCASEGDQGQAQEPDGEQPAGQETMVPETGSTKTAAEPEEEQPAGQQSAAVGTEELSVRDAVGQMLVVGMEGTEPNYYIEKMVRERNIGGVLLFGYNMESEEQTRRLTGSLQELSMQTEPAIPLLAVDC